MSRHHLVVPPGFLSFWSLAFFPSLNTLSLFSPSQIWSTASTNRSSVIAGLIYWAVTVARIPHICVKTGRNIPGELPSRCRHFSHSENFSFQNILSSCSSVTVFGSFHGPSELFSTFLPLGSVTWEVGLNRINQPSSLESGWNWPMGGPKRWSKDNRSDNLGHSCLLSLSFPSHKLSVVSFSSKR